MSCRFKDSIGWEWNLALNYGLASDVEKQTGVNLTLVSKSADWVDLLFGDPGRLVGVLWVICEEQAKGLDLPPERFAYRFDGPVLEAAGIALANAIASFFPRSKIGEAIRLGLPKILAVADQRAIEGINRAISTASTSAGGSPESVG